MMHKENGDAKFSRQRFQNLGFRIIAAVIDFGRCANFLEDLDRNEYRVGMFSNESANLFL